MYHFFSYSMSLSEISDVKKQTPQTSIFPLPILISTNKSLKAAHVMHQHSTMRACSDILIRYKFVISGQIYHRYFNCTTNRGSFSTFLVLTPYFDLTAPREGNRSIAPKLMLQFNVSEPIGA